MNSGMGSLPRLERSVVIGDGCWSGELGEDGGSPGGVVGGHWN